MNRAQISPPQRHQVALRLPLVHREEHLGVVERLDRLDGHVVGVTGADADDVDMPTHGHKPIAHHDVCRSP